ncbi:PTS family fructose/mannitol porter component IIBC [Lactobacillus pasteurii DSM 23907 = CRBIP 24.76]|uniref:PTS family fructose/mannitol porter component IIBC n=1 Tax=Lactobacillus pasteurii DSM 23907 = CRBIP 24.76 TaxID=1423790 RepID=I7LBF6_9LACO|nr:PTS family fructose/mannitol porter component IIBC [Lactobacillus pasteurii DSM 23907 = CRBIP 24.76]
MVLIFGHTKKVIKKKLIQSSDAPYVVAVIACPTGIAHTYMAEESLHKTAQKMGVAIKVETNSSEGVKHQLTAEDIEKAAGVIIAADKKVEMSRFDGKPLINHLVIDGIKKPQELIETILNKKVPIYHAEKGNQNLAQDEKKEEKSIWQKVYQDLMNGISNMLPFVVGGGILMAISFMLEQAAGKDSTSFIFLNSLGNYAFSFLIPVLAGFIAYSIGDRPALMPGFVGGYMATQPAASVIQSKGSSGFIGGIIAGFLAGYAILLGAILAGMQAFDLGGPVNKAAYTTAIGVLAETGKGNMMASVMIGGMIPPLAIAFATTIWAKKFTESERKAGISNWVLGISFITEGAIPFAISDPVRVIGSSVVGSAIGGALAQLWQVNVPAPHGGLWVVLLIRNAPFFIASLLIGMVIAGTIYGLWRKPAED